VGKSLEVRIYLGTSGWQYRDWKGTFYPPKLKQTEWLEHYSERFQTVEVNNTFYRLPERKTFEQWAERTPEDFVFVVKASRYLSHIKRLQEPAEPVQRLMERAAGLGKKLGPVLVQLPPNLKKDIDSLDETLGVFGDSVKVALEFRHETWFDGETKDVLAKHGAAFCLADRGSRVITPLWRTAPWIYLRFHEGRASPRPCYGRGALESWVDRLASVAQEGDDIYVYFNNDTRGCAIRDSIQFASLASAKGFTVTRVP
jgi:uncharacterized protein YecE (DUF72 family)